MLRSIRFNTSNTWLINVDNMMGVGYWDGYLRPLHPQISWWPVMDGAYYPNGNANVPWHGYPVSPANERDGDCPPDQS